MFKLTLRFFAYLLNTLNKYTLFLQLLFMKKGTIEQMEIFGGSVIVLTAAICFLMFVFVCFSLCSRMRNFSIMRDIVISFGRTSCWCFLFIVAFGIDYCFRIYIIMLF